MPTSSPRKTFRFDDFELDVAAYELRRRGRPVKLARQSMDLLILLVESRGQLVSRGDMVERLWGKDVFVDVETGVNTAISKVRQALRDSVDAPAFVETVPGKGYRFIAAVEVVSGALPDHESPPRSQRRRRVWTPVQTASPPLRPGTSNRARLAIGLAVVAVIAGGVAWTWLRGGAVASRVTLAVLPFANIGSDPEREYLATGLTEETSVSLATIDPGHLIVKGRTLRYKGTTKTAGEIGHELSVDYLVESTIRAEGGSLRVTATLIRVRDQEHVWSQSYDRELTGILGLQLELSTAIADQIRVRLSPDDIRRTGGRQTQEPERLRRVSQGTVSRKPANADYQRARHKGVPAGGCARPELRAGLVQPGFDLCRECPEQRCPSPRSVASGAGRRRSRGQRQSEPRESQMLVGYTDWLLNWDWTAAETALRLAIRLDPTNGTAYRMLGHVLSQSGRHGEAESAMRRTRELEPLEPINYALSAQVAFQGREYRAAVEHARRAILMDSEFWIGYVQLGQAYESTGDTDLALAALRDAARFSGGNSKAISLSGYILAKTGRATEAREVLRRLEADAGERYVPPYAMALVHAGLGEREAVFEWLDKAYAGRDVHLIYLPVDPKWDPVRADPRFNALVARCGFTQKSGNPIH